MPRQAIKPFTNFTALKVHLQLLALNNARLLLTFSFRQKKRTIPSMNTSYRP
jgi:hypothetical protein